MATPSNPSNPSAKSTATSTAKDTAKATAQDNATPKAVEPATGTVATVAPPAGPVRLPNRATVGVPLNAGQHAVADGIAFVAPYTGLYVTAGLNNGWPCLPGRGKVLAGTVAVAGPAGAAGAPATVLVAGVPMVQGTTKNGAKAGEYKAWPYSAAALAYPGQGS